MGREKQTVLAEQKQVVSERKLRLSWQVFLSCLAVLAAVGAVLLHLLGDVIHRTYLDAWGLDAGMFPKGADWLLIHGYTGLIGRSLSALDLIRGKIAWFVGTAVICGLILLAFPAGDMSSNLTEPLPSRLRSIARLYRAVLFSLALSVGSIPAFMFVAIAASVPAAVGELAGMGLAKDHAVEFALGCDDSRYRCATLLRDGTQIAKGFILDSSTSHIAMFDVTLKRGRVLPLEGLELQGSGMPK